MISITAGSIAFAESNTQPMVLYDNCLTRATIANNTLPATGPRSRAITGETFDYWNATATPDTLRGTFGTAETADCCFIAAHTLSGVQVNVQRLVAATWTDTATFTPTSNNPFLMIFPAQSSTGWGIQVASPRRVGVLMIGKRLVIPGGVVPGYSPVWASREIDRFPNVSMRGHFLGQRRRSAGASLSAQFMPISHDFALNSMRAFRDVYNDGDPFVWASAPSVFSEDVAYCWADKGAVFSPSILAGGQLCDLTLQMRAYCEP
jgi:hypothetical protein